MAKFQDFGEDTFRKLSSARDRLAYIKDMARVSSYPADQELYGMGIDLKDVAGKTIIDIGSGASDVVDLLLKSGANAFGIDPVYLGSLVEIEARAMFNHTLLIPTYSKKYLSEIQQARQRFLKSFRRNRERYLGESVTGMPSIPDGSVDIALSANFMTSYLSCDLVLYREGVEAVLRKLKLGGALYMSPYNQAGPAKVLGGDKLRNQQTIEVELQQSGRVVITKPRIANITTGIITRIK